MTAKQNVRVGPVINCHEKNRKLACGCFGRGGLALCNDEKNREKIGPNKTKNGQGVLTLGHKEKNTKKIGQNFIQNG